MGQILNFDRIPKIFGIGKYTESRTVKDRGSNKVELFSADFTSKLAAKN